MYSAGFFRKIGGARALGLGLCLGLACVSAGDLEAAPGPDQVQEAARVLARVDSLLSLGMLEEGGEVAAQGAQRFAADPRLVDPLENRWALALMRLERHIEALPLLERAVQRRPGSGAAHRNLGACLQALGRRGRALSEYREFVHLEPRNFRAHLELGQVFLEFGMQPQAVQSLRTAASLCGDCPEVDPALATALLESAQPAGALIPLRRLVAGPRGEAYHRHYLQALLESGADDELILYLVQRPHELEQDEVRLLVEAEGRRGQSHWSRALLGQAGGQGASGLQLGPNWDHEALLWARVSLNLQLADDLPSALVAIERAIALDPDSALLRNNRVVLLQDLGRLDEARAEWRRAVALDPSLEKK